MTEPLPPDPYVALGVPKTADSQTIKSTYKKLVLKCHPDKFPDESVKQQKQEEFQKIQEAYETLSNDEKRSRYDAQVRLAELRKEALERQRKGGDAARPDVRTTGYKIRTAEPSAAFFTAHGPTRPAPETRSRAHDDTDRYYEEQRASSRKYDGYESYSHRSPRAEREDRARAEKKKTRERDERRERSYKYAARVEDDDSDDRANYEASYRRRSHEDRLGEEARRRMEDEARRRAEDARKRAEEHRKEAESRARKARRDGDQSDGHERKLREKESEARDYIQRSRTSADDIRPQAGRTTSGSSTQFYEIRRSRASRERRSSRERERKGSYPEIVEPEGRPPTFEKAHSSPANIKVPRTSPHRAHTMQPEYSREPPRLSRADSEPIRKKEVVPPQPSKLRESTIHDSGYSSPGTPETQHAPQASAKPPATSTKYRYASASGGVPLATADDFSTGHRTILREPGRYRQRSPSPLSRETVHERAMPAGVRTFPSPAPSAIRYQTVPHASPTVRVEDVREERERGRDRSSRPLFGEVTDSSSYRRGDKPGSFSYGISDVKFAKRYGRDDVQWSSSAAYNAGYEAAKRDILAGKERWDDAGKPRMERSATYAY